MKKLWLLSLACVLPLLAGCPNKKDGDDDDDDFVVGACDAGDAAFVRTATLGVLGRRTFGQYEVDAILAAAAPAGEDASARRTAILSELFASESEYVDRWAEALMDHLRVARIDDQELGSCYGGRSRGDDDGSLAEYVRDNPATATGDGNGTFTMRDLLESAIRADDLSPVYRAHLFAMMSRPIPAANVPRVEAELARRQDFGYVFDAVYLNRDLVCLGCHNSEFSVTDGEGDDDRHWPVRGHFEKALWGSSAGTTPESAHAMFRCDGFVSDGFFLCMGGGTDRPWGWSSGCGEFEQTLPEPDPAGISANFATLTGMETSVYDLEAALARGIAVLAQDGLELDSSDTPVDSEAAFAYLVGMSIAEMVWEEIAGSPLTIANYYPRNRAQRDELERITDRFVESHFSLRTLITAVLASPYLNQAAPETGCGDEAYVMPAIFDPWVLGESTAALRNNSPADGIAPLSAMALTRAAHQALEWPLREDRMFPRQDNYVNDVVFMRGVGMFLKNGEPGFRGLDFQARLTWEAAYAPCDIGAATDFVSGVVTAATTNGATVRDVAVALKDRIVNEASIDETPAASGGSGEAAAIEALFGAALGDPASSVADLEGASRRFCGALLSSPQFLLSGLSDPTSVPVPLLNPGD